MEKQSFRAKQGIGYLYVGIPAFLIFLLFITLAASGGDFYIGPGGLSILFLIMGIWYLTSDIITKENDLYTVKLSAFAQKHTFEAKDIKQVDDTNPRKLVILLNSNKKVKIGMNIFSEEDKVKVRQLFK
jgi:hypothetical protein